MTKLPPQFRPLSNSEDARVWFFITKRLTLPVSLGSVCKRFRDDPYVVVTVVPSLVVVLLLFLPSLKRRPGGSSSVGMTYTGSDAPVIETDFLFRTMFLRSLNVVVTVVPSSKVVLPSVGKIRSGRMSSEGMTYTGSDAAMMETGERSAFATGLAREGSMQRSEKKMALKSRGW